MNDRSPQRGRRAIAAEQLRNRLLDGAERLLGERRPGAITSRDIARAAGVSDGVLYNHFADKHDLLLSALVRRFTRLVTAWTAQTEPAGSGTPDESVSRLVRHAHALQLAALPMLANLAGDPPLLERFLIEIHRPPLGGDALRRPVAEHLAAEQALGRLGAFDPDTAADVLIGAVLLQGLIDVLAHRPAEESQRHLAAIAATLVAGLAVRAPEPATTRTKRRTR
jgi:AcrR family transcriptional regulator